MTYTQAPKWTPAEVQILRDNYATKCRKELMALLPQRSDFSIGSKARELGLRSLVRGGLEQVKSHWNEWDSYHLKTIYSNSTKAQIQAVFPTRSWASIEERAARLGLRKTPEFLKKIRAEAAKLNRATKEKQARVEFEQREEKRVVIIPATVPNEMARKALAQRTPLEQAWSGQ